MSVAGSLSISSEVVVEDVIVVACAGVIAPVSVTATTPATTSHLITPPLRGASTARSWVGGKSKEYSRAAKPLQSAALRGVVSLAVWMDVNIIDARGRRAELSDFFTLRRDAAETRP
jgi:hypothetical protein